MYVKIIGKEKNIENKIENDKFNGLNYEYDKENNQYVIYDEENNIRGYAEDESELKKYQDNPDYNYKDTPFYYDSEYFNSTVTISGEN